MLFRVSKTEITLLNWEFLPCQWILHMVQIHLDTCLIESSVAWSIIREKLLPAWLL
ncbi:hypothetical protein CJ030_MR5G025135 [Morella rubra]|uniref:Uncharacterized protein n=1 Tax=Morella rubra TaxID=262757 RepID=A0A6A1VKB9_9ROSI|nr:hypothetical protein CJ030_MR5G025135 [Morella rubra]